MLGDNNSNNSNKPVFSNLFENLPDTSDEEAIEIIASANNLVIERIVSEGQTSDDWYDQDETEFCAVLSGAADLLFDGGDPPVRMRPGAWVIIPAHCRHKVSWTDPAVKTVWIAVKWKPSDPPVAT